MERDPRKLRPVAAGQTAANDNPSPSEVCDELARLIATQHDGGLPQSLAERRRASELELARLETRGRVRLAGDELREHTIYLAKHELLAAGLDRDGTLRENVSMTLDRAEIARKSAALLAAFHGSLDAVLEFAQAHEPEEFDERGYRRPRYESQAWHRLRVVAHHVQSHYDEIREGSLSNEDLAEITRPCTVDELEEIAKWLADEPDQPPALPGWAAASGESLRPRACIVAALAHRPWTHRLRACASIVLGQWPESIDVNEPLFPEHVIVIEQNNLRQLHSRLTHRKK